MSDRHGRIDEDDKKRRRPEEDPLLEEARSHPGESPNRDEDEFDNGLDHPDTEKEAEREADKATDNG